MFSQASCKNNLYSWNTRRKKNATNITTYHWKFDEIFYQNSKIGSFFKQRSICPSVKDKNSNMINIFIKVQGLSYKGKISCSMGHQAKTSQTLILELTSLGIQRPVMAPFPIGKDCPLMHLCDEPHNAPYTSGSCEGLCKKLKQ